MDSPFLARITVYPVKALDPVRLVHATITPGGSLTWDRRWAMLDRSGKFINGKRNPKVHLLRAEFDLEHGLMRARRQGERPWHELPLRAGDPSLERWLTDFFGEEVSVVENRASGFPDDVKAPGPTVVSTGSLDAVASWFPELDADMARRRFRVNLEVDGVPPFWEDLQFGANERRVFRIGDVKFEGVNPCARCVVPTRDPETAEPIPGFQRVFMERRAATLPEGVARERFHHAYRFTLNTAILPGQEGISLSVGDAVLTAGDAVS
jgi:uncharacterized protein YcbX